jgi:S-(hydroxymethyl)glutathione synthase
MAEQGTRVVGGCPCGRSPARHAYTKRLLTAHYCLCTDRTDICGAALAVIAAIDRKSIRVTQGESKIKSFDTKPACHRRSCPKCGCQVFLDVDAIPDLSLMHVATTDRESEVGAKPDRRVFTRSEHPRVTIPTDGLPRQEGQAPPASA